MYIKEKKEIIFWARKLYERNLIVGAAGNISLKLGRGKILITTHQSYLGYATGADLVIIDEKGNVLTGSRQPTSEKKLHLVIHKHFKEKVILHAHPLFTNLYFSRYKKLKTVSFEPQVYLKNFGVVPQSGPNVVATQPVVKALKKSNIAVLKNHGVICIADDFKKALSLIELLEKEAKTNILLKCIHE